MQFQSREKIARQLFPGVCSRYCGLVQPLLNYISHCIPWNYLGRGEAKHYICNVCIEALEAVKGPFMDVFEQLWTASLQAQVGFI